MSIPRDLTRWNRAGLSRFRYVDGNAATHLEVLREALAQRFPEWQALTADTSNELAADRLDRLLTQYEAERRDWLWEIGRGLARAGHVLTEHLDAYAGEGFLGTATRWDNVRRLVEMLGYHPAPPASASTLLVLEAKDLGVVEKGFQVRYTPPDGGSPVVFETLGDVTIDPALNGLRLSGHDRCPTLVSGSTLKLEGQIEKLSIGQPVVLEDQSKEDGQAFQARVVAGIDVTETGTRITFTEPFENLAKGYALIHLDPADKLEPLGPAAGEVQVKASLWLEGKATVLTPGDVVFIRDGTRAYYRQLVAVDGRRLSWDSAQPLGTLDLAAAHVSRAWALEVTAAVEFDLTVAGDFSHLVGTQVVVLASELVELEVLGAEYRDGETVLTMNALSQSPSVVYVPPVGREFEVDSFIRGSDSGPPVTAVETEIPRKTSAGDLAVILRAGRRAWGRLSHVGVDLKAGRAVLSVAPEEGWRDNWSGSDDERFYLAGTTIHGHFRQVVRLEGWRRNDTPVSGSSLELEGVDSEISIAESLVQGRALFLEQVEGGGAVHQAVVTSKNSQQFTLGISPPLALEEGFTVGNTVIRANLVLAGHGERKRERILGSGDATVSSASFVLRQEGVSHVADDAMPSGVRADLSLRVEDRIWRQVATLRGSRPSDPHYTARQTEEGHVRISFGDGQSGQRLPTGTNHVRVSFRTGAGLAGNVGAGSLVKAVRPHRLVGSIRQPVSATGGGEREDVAALRKNAPASVLTLERAVSAADFARLAARHSSVWQAHAFAVSPGTLSLSGQPAPLRPGRQGVEVVAVPAGGGVLAGLAETLRDFLTAHTLPGIEVVVSSHESVLFTLEVTCQIKTAEFDPPGVLDNVRAALFEALSLRRGVLGRDLYLSGVYAVVEQVPGVESSRCVLGGDPTLQRLVASPRQVIHLDPEADQVLVEYQEFKS